MTNEWTKGQTNKQTNKRTPKIDLVCESMIGNKWTNADSYIFSSKQNSSGWITRYNSNLYISNRPGNWADQIIYVIYCFKCIYWFSIALIFLIDFHPSSLLATVEGIGRSFNICYSRYKQGLSNISKYIFTRGFFSVEVNKINTSWFRAKTTSLID